MNDTADDTAAPPSTPPGLTAAAATDDEVPGPEVPGWYGKLPSLGDFAQRRLDPGFVEAWDDWLARELAAWQASDPEGWLPRYLAGSSWRFLLLPGCLDAGDGGHPDRPVAGVLMPSVDRVGRYFPLTLAWPLDALPDTLPGLRRLFAQLHQLDDLALDALQDDWPVDQLEAELLAWSRRQAATAHETPRSGDLRDPGLPAAGRMLTLAPASDLAAGLADAALAQRLADWSGGALWWSASHPGHARLRLSRGLPRGDDFISLFLAPDAVDPSSQED